MKASDIITSCAIAFVSSVLFVTVMPWMFLWKVAHGRILFARQPEQRCVFLWALIIIEAQWSMVFVWILKLLKPEFF